MFHDASFYVTTPSSSAAGQTAKARLIWASSIILGTVFSIIIGVWSIRAITPDAYIQSTLRLNGSEENGGQLFRVNCVGCHGITAQGFLGPDLHSVSKRLKEKDIINQILKGRTPPMPSYEIEPNEMADLLAYLHSLS